MATITFGCLVLVALVTSVVFLFAVGLSHTH